MALESSGGFRSSSSPVKLRSTSLVVLSAGAALVALIGYLYMKSRQSKEKETTTTEKTKRKVSAAVVSKEEKEENSHKEVEEEETELVMSIVDTETVVVDKETKSSCCHKQEEANCSEIEIVEEVDFERISRDLVRIVLNCAVKKMVHENDELTHLMRYIYNCAIIYEHTKKNLISRKLGKFSPNVFILYFISTYIGSKMTHLRKNRLYSKIMRQGLFLTLSSKDKVKNLIQIVYELFLSIQFLSIQSNFKSNMIF